MLRIALVGKNKAAKTWAGNYLKEKHKFTHKRLGDPVENFVKNTFYYLGRERGKVFSWSQKLAIYDYLYKMRPDIWVGLMEERMKTQQKDAVVSDVRYIDELEFLRDKVGFTIVRVHAPPPRLTNVTQALGREYASGTLYLAEMYAKDFTETIRADHSITFDPKNRQPAKDALNALVKTWRREI